MQKTPLEDNIEDVLGKSSAGLKMDAETLASASGQSPASINNALKGEVGEALLEAVSPHLQLDAASLIHRLQEKAYPSADFPDGLAGCTTPYPIPGYEEMTVNAYVAWDPASRSAVVFDSGAAAGPLVEIIVRHGLQVEAILLTHTHGDHIAALPELRAQTGNPPVFVHQREVIDSATPFSSGHSWAIGKLRVRAVDTPGHSAGGTTFVIDGLAAPVAIVGDALFAGSAGGAPSAWSAALNSVREGILGLPDNTVLCPGHGPVTSVAIEKQLNPLFPEFK